MSKKIIGVVIGVCLLSAFVFYLSSAKWVETNEDCASRFVDWRGNLSGDVSGSLHVHLDKQKFQFQWSSPAAEGISEKDSALLDFLSQPWEIDGPALKLSSGFKKLSPEAREKALPIIRIISRPFLAPNWAARAHHSTADTADHGKLRMLDYDFSRWKFCSISRIRIFEQTGQNYQKPDTKTEVVFSKKPISWDGSIEVKSAVILPSLLSFPADSPIAPANEKAAQANELHHLLRDLSMDASRAAAEEAIKVRIERGIYEEELWLAILREMKPDSIYLNFALDIGKMYILNFPGAFRDSKEKPYSDYLWK